MIEPKISSMPTSTVTPNAEWTSEFLFMDGEKYFGTLVQCIDQAQTEICLETYILGMDEVGTKIVERLLAAVHRGVAVCLLVDGFGSSAWLYSHFQTLKEKGVDVRIYHPLPLPITTLFWKDLYNDPKYVLRYLLNINRRNHRKLVVIDRKFAFVGSRNICEDSRDWRETSVYLEGPGVAMLRRTFEDVWNRSFSHVPRIPRPRWRGPQAPPSPVVFSNHSKQQRRQKHDEIFRRWNMAQDSIWITTPYFNPPGRMFRTILKKAREGVRIYLLLPSRSDILAANWLNQSYYRELLAAGVRIFEYLPGMIHAKWLVIDHWILLGSSNLNHRSYLRDLELDVALTHERSLTVLREAFERDIGESTEIKDIGQVRFRFFKRIFLRFLLLFRSWF